MVHKNELLYKATPKTKMVITGVEKLVIGAICIIGTLTIISFAVLGYVLWYAAHFVPPIPTG